jgi:DNA-binding transcriptional ArsR family regulator
MSSRSPEEALMAVALARIRMPLIYLCIAPADRPRPGFRAASRQVETVLTYNQMVAYQLTDEAVDRLFHALADATRRDILRRCVRDEPSVSRLAKAYTMTFAAVQKHVAVLERAGLVTKERRGREQLVRADPDAVRRARQALDALETAWRGRVDRMSDLLAGSRPSSEQPPRGSRR